MILNTIKGILNPGKYLLHILWIFHFLLIMVAGCLIPAKSFSQNSASFDHLSVNEGLSQSTIYAITQDHKGFIWFGTRGGGLNRYDGYDFLVMKNDPNDPSSLSDNEVISIFEDSHEALWIGTRNGGLNRYDWTTGGFKRYFIISTPGNEKLTPGAVNVLYEDKEGHLYAGHNEGISLYDRETDSFRDLQYNIPMQVKGVTGISEDNLGNLYFATWDRLIKYNRSSTKTEYLKYEIDPYTETGGRIIPLLIDSRDNLWIGTTSGLKLVDTKTDLKFAENIPADLDLTFTNSYVRSITETRDGTIWFGTLDGLFRFDPKSLQISAFQAEPNNPESLAHNSVYTVFEDKVGTLWIGTWSGVDILDSRKYKFSHFEHQINNPNSLSNNNVSSFQEDEDGMWIGTEQGGLNYMDKKTFLFNAYNSKKEDPGSLRRENVKSLFLDSNGDLWVGTLYGGLSQLKRQTGKFMHYLEDHAVYAIREWPAGKLWIGTMSGLKVMDLETRLIRDYESDKPAGELLDSTFITQLYVDSFQKMWLGTKDDGLFRFGPGESELVRFIYKEGDSSSISSNYVISLCEDNNSSIWIGTNNGLNKYNPETSEFIRLDRSLGLEDNVINSIQADEFGKLWIATNKGIYRYNTVNGKVKHFDFRDGLQSNEFNRGSSYKDRSGTLYFGGIGGFNAFQPGQIKANSDKPQVVITDFKLFNKSVKPGEKNSPLQKHISETQNISLNFRQSSFSFEFVSLNYLNPEKNQYSYILEGFEDDWNPAGPGRTATYMNLKAGKYIFKVIASNNDGTWNETGPSVSIHVKAPYWRHPVALVIYSFLLAGMIWLLFKLISYSEKKENELKMERLEKERLKDLNQMKLQFFTNISHEFRTPLTLITGPLEKLINETAANKEYLYGLMKSNVNRMLRLVNQLMDFRKIENEKMPLHIQEGNLDHLLSQIVLGFEDLASQKMIELTYRPDTENPDEELQWFDEGIIDKVIYNLLSNAFKFTPEQGIIQIRLKIKEENAEIIVQDTGKGIDQDKVNRIFERFYSESPEIYSGTGIGLSLSKKLIDIHRGEITVDSEKGKGSTFRVIIPINREEYKDEEVFAKEMQMVRNRPGLDIENAEDLFRSEDPDVPNKYPVHIMIVEDNEDLLKYLLDHFKRFDVKGARNGKEAYQWAVEKIPDLIISDVMMPEMDGIELCNSIKENFITSHIPVILLTAKSAVEQKIEGLGVGADAYIEKPFNSDYLSALVDNLLAQRKKLREKFSENSDFIIDDDLINESDKKFLRKIEETISENISDSEFSLEQLLSEVNMSRSQLYRKFKALVNKNPSEYIRIIRLKYAVTLLNQKQYSVNEIAYMSGFGNVSYFITCFKKYYGKSPRKFMESNSS